MIFIGVVIGCLIAAIGLCIEGEVDKASTMLVFALLFVGVSAAIGKNNAGTDSESAEFDS